MAKKILMVCLGNTCRSPIAEAVMLEILKKAGLSENWHVDSAAIADWNVNCPPEPRALRTMAKHGLSYSNQGRQIQEDHDDAGFEKAYQQSVIACEAFLKNVLFKK
ncbi:hypothetical protein GQX74_015285 [Glossina fuscipes]|nr:hypothetical protein GQX74_015285 [Glossina fuscipes]